MKFTKFRFFPVEQQMRPPRNPLQSICLLIFSRYFLGVNSSECLASLREARRVLKRERNYERIAEIKGK